MADYGSGFVYSAGEDFFGIDSNEGGLTVQNYKPAIRVKKVWDAIFDKFGYTYTGSFWNQPFLDDVYMVCNYGLKYPEFAGVDLETYGLARIGPITGSGTDLVIASGSTPTRLAWYNTLNDPGNFIGDNGSYLIGSNNSDVRGLLNLELQVSGAFGMPTTVNLHYWPTGSTPSGAGSGYTTLVNINKYFTDVANAKIAEGSTSGINQKFSVQTEFKTSTLTKNTFYYFGLAYYNGFVSTIKVISDPGGTTKSFLELKEQLAAADGRIMEIPLNMPFGTNGIKLVDWIKGIQKKFNLIIYPNKTKPGQMIVETFNEWYNKGVRKDFNKYINLNNNISVVPANNLAVNKLSFGDALDGDYLALQFSKKQNRNFGTAYYVDTENFFSQGDLKVETTFGVSPLAYIAGTGLSGSVGGLNPSVTQYLVGTIQISPKPAGADTCASINYLPLYTSTGYITTGLTLYIDQYGNNSLFGVRSVTDNNTFETYDVDYTTGVIGYGSGYFC
jgi:hypothetical protein